MQPVVSSLICSAFADSQTSTLTKFVTATSDSSGLVVLASIACSAGCHSSWSLPTFYTSNKCLSNV